MLSCQQPSLLPPAVRATPRQISLENIDGGEPERVDDGPGWQPCAGQSPIHISSPDAGFFGECGLAANTPDLTTQ